MYCLSHGHNSTCATFLWSRKMFYILKTFAYDAWKNFYRLLNSNSLAKTHTKLFLKNELTPPKTLQSSFKLKKSSKNATTLIFFQWKLRCCSFQIQCQGDRGGTCQHKISTFLTTLNPKKFNIEKNFKLKFTLPKSPRGPPDTGFGKSNILAFTGKKIMS